MLGFVLGIIQTQQTKTRLSQHSPARSPTTSGPQKQKTKTPSAPQRPLRCRVNPSAPLPPAPPLAIGLANLLDWPLDWAAPAFGLANLLDWLVRELGNSGNCICKLVGLGALLCHSLHRRQLCNRAFGLLDCWIDIRWPILYCMNVMLFCHIT